MPREYEIVPARRDHVPHLAAVERAAAALFPEEDLSPEERDIATPAADLDAASREGRLWVAVTIEDQPVGFALADILDGEAHLEELDVHPDHGRHGLGSALVARVCAWARTRGFRSVTLTTFSHLPWNAPFYEGLGFRLIDAGELSPELSRVLGHEQARGLQRRVAMRLELEAAP